MVREYGCLTTCPSLVNCETDPEAKKAPNCKPKRRYIMPLDPKIKALLDQMAGLPRIEELSVAAARKQVESRIPANLPTLAVASMLNRSIPGPGADLRVRIYTPNGNGPFPLMVFFHGSGFVLCSLDTHDGTCRNLCNASGCIVVSVDYRLAPEHKFPAGSEDCYAATKWAAEHARELDADPGRVIIAGDSAGGNMVVTALMIRDKGGPALRGQLMIYPVTDYFNSNHPSYSENAEGYGLTAAGMRSTRSKDKQIVATPIFLPEARWRDTR